MNVFLMYPDKDFNIKTESPWNERFLIEDLELDILFSAMAGDDEIIRKVVQTAVLTGFENSTDTIKYRHEVLKDCLNNPDSTRELFIIASKAIELERKIYLGIYRYPTAIIHRSLDVMDGFIKSLKQIRNIAETNHSLYKSQGFTRFFDMIRNELNDSYFNEIQSHLSDLRFKKGALFSAEIGNGNKGENYTLLRQKDFKQSIWKDLVTIRQDRNLIIIGDRDDRGFRALAEIKDKGLNNIANSLAQSVDHILSFFNLLHTELAFYSGCLNLHNIICEKKQPYSFPQLLEEKQNSFEFEELYDVCLLLTSIEVIIGNDLQATNKDLFVITGANQGGKSTYLRSIGLAQLMMQAGMFVPAKYYKSKLFNSIYTHYRREEDETMKSGKLDEELSRMNDIIDEISSRSMILFNESFSATNDREGSEIARQIILPLIEKGIRVFFVTHLTDFAASLYKRNSENFLFLRADRQNDGERSFKIFPGEPLETSFGQDLYKPIFND
ncbi:MAG: DNA mismatch repair protein MutS [Chloroflexi bacterium]|nr:DNA mismatch repair protein MutS [Chloroflexota bacterium]BCY17259.1 DNA mismatch repair protein MutS [Leptolinea sp. HRD-7]